MAPSVVLFRGLIIASVLSGFMSSLVDAQFPELLPATLLDAAKALPKAPIEVALSLNLLSFMVLSCALAAMAGLYMFKPWARGFALGITIVNLIFYPLAGASVKSGWSLLLVDVSSTLWGAVLAMSYVSSLSRRFAFDYAERPDELE